LLKRRIFALKRNSLPPITTHLEPDSPREAVQCELRPCQDRLSSRFLKLELLGLDYEEFVRGCHLDVFPSYYEPWGYTPAECTVVSLVVELSLCAR
jgi:glycogen(starch) synthase